MQDNGMEEQRLCESVMEQITDLFVGDKHFSEMNISEQVYRLFKNKEFHCVEKIVKTIPDSILQNFIMNHLMQHAEFDDEDYSKGDILSFYKTVSYYRLKIQASWRLGWHYIDSIDLKSAIAIQVETLRFIETDCPILSDYYLATVIGQYVSSKANENLDIDYDIAIRYFLEMMSNEKIIIDICKLISDFESHYMQAFDCQYMILGIKEDDCLGLTAPLPLLHARRAPPSHSWGADGVEYIWN